MEPSSRILFVDDEPRVLEGLRDLLRRQRKVWDMHFAVGGAEAIKQLDLQSYDVIVTDAKMPQIDGVAVLKYARERRPEAVRIVLSGEAGENLALRLSPHAHQSLAKPCRIGELEITLTRACALRRLVEDPAIRAILGQIRELPALPRTYTRLVSVLEDERVGMLDVCHIVETDLALSAKLLQLVNSAFFGAGRAVKTLLQAIQLLGLELVKSLALSTGVFCGDGLGAERLAFFEALQTHSMDVAFVACALSTIDERRNVFTTALLHDIGLLIELQHMPHLLLKGGRQTTPHIDWEQAEDVLHPSIGAYLLGLWGLPLDVMDCVANHHAPLGPDSSATSRILRRAEDALHAAEVELPDAGPTAIRELALKIAPTLDVVPLEKTG